MAPDSQGVEVVRVRAGPAGTPFRAVCRHPLGGLGDPASPTAHCLQATTHSLQAPRAF